jgi:hypothetical protein
MPIVGSSVQRGTTQRRIVEFRDDADDSAESTDQVQPVRGGEYIEEGTARIGRVETESR